MNIVRLCVEDVNVVAKFNYLRDFCMNIVAKVCWDKVATTYVEDAKGNYADSATTLGIFTDDEMSVMKLDTQRRKMPEHGYQIQCAESTLSDAKPAAIFFQSTTAALTAIWLREWVRGATCCTCKRWLKENPNYLENLVATDEPILINADLDAMIILITGFTVLPTMIDIYQVIRNIGCCTGDQCNDISDAVESALVINAQRAGYDVDITKLFP